MLSKYQFVRMYGPDMTFVLGLDNFYAIVVPKNLSGDYALPSEVSSVKARIVKMGAPSVMFEVDCEITESASGFAVALAEFDKDVNYTGIDAGNILYLQFVVDLTNGDQIIYPEPPQRLIVVRPSWSQAGEPPPTAGEPAYVISLRADNNPEMFGRITLASGDNIRLVQDTDSKKITINATLTSHTHPLSDIEQSGAEINQVPKWSGTSWVAGNVDWTEITNKPDQYPPEPHAHTHYVGGTDPLTGDLDANARVEVDRNGVFVGKRRKLNFIEGNNVFLQISDDATNERINILLNSLDTFHLAPEDWQSPVTFPFVNMGFFPWRTNESVSYLALYGENNVTRLLTDNNDSTFVRVYRDTAGNYHFISCSINPRAVYSVRFKVVSVGRPGVVDIRAVDYRGNSVALWGGAFSSISVSDIGWYEVTLRSETGVSNIKIISNAGNPADVNIAEVEIIGGLSLWGWFVSSLWGGVGYYNEGIIRTTVYLSKNNTYKFAAWFGTMGNQQYMKVEGRLLDEQGIVTVFRSLSPIGTSSEDQLVMISGDLITPPLSKFYNIEWRMVSDHRAIGGPPFHIYFLGMSIYSGENPAPATIGHTHSLSDITQSAALDKQVPKWNAQYQRWEAAYVDWSEIQNRPQYFPAQPHTHDATEIVANRFSFARMPTSSTANSFLVVRTANEDPIYDTIKSSDLPALLDSNARVSVQRSGALIGTRRAINFIAGSGISISASDDAANERVNITITNTGGGGGGGGEHNLLDGVVHRDTAATTVARGMVIVGRQQADESIKWQGLALGASGTVLKSNGTDAVWGNVDWTEVQNKPSTFPPSPHTHSAADITSGRLSASRLPTSPTANRFLVVRTANSDPIYDTIQVSDLPSHTHTRSQITDFAHASTHQAGGSDPITGNLDANARVTVKQSGTVVGRRRAINFIAGSNISLSISDDATNEEVDVTISAAGGGSSSHNLLDGVVHPDTEATTVQRGMLIVGKLSGATVRWGGLPLGAAGRFLRSNGTDAVWDVIQVSDLPSHTHTKSQITDLETITTTPTANAVPKADATGKIALGWIPQGSGSNLDADKLDGLDSTAFERIANKGVANGYAPLDANAKLPATHLPNHTHQASEVDMPVTEQTTSYTLQLTDKNSFIKMNSTTAVTVTIPTNASVAFPIGTKIAIMKYGTGDVTIVGATGVTLRDPNNQATITTQYDVRVIVKIGTDEWAVI